MSSAFQNTGINAATCDDRLILQDSSITEEALSREDFQISLFDAFKRSEIRYCVLHSWEEIPQDLSSDLDLAVHPEDRPKLNGAFHTVCRLGYKLVQVINYFVDAYCFRFVWIGKETIGCISIDIIFRRQRGALVAPSVIELLSGTRIHKMFNIPTAESEFLYLLAKKTWKSTISPEQSKRLSMLLDILGRAKAERLTARLFSKKMSVRVVDACATGQLVSLLPAMKRDGLLISTRRHPVKLLRDLAGECLRRFRRWRKPLGLFLVVMGPDGAGKSTLIANLLETIGDVFQCNNLFHWRPMVLFRREADSDSTRPHHLPPYGALLSSAHLIAHLADYWAGYWIMIRPLLVRCSLVVFDRYYNDVLIDPKRYRYGGPLSIVRLLRPLVPAADVTLILDAPESVLLARKREVAPEEVRRQRQLYYGDKDRSRNTGVLDAAAPIPRVKAEAAEIILSFLHERVRRLHPAWIFSDEAI